MSARARLSGALGLVLLVGAGALLLSGRAWQTVTAPRSLPFTDEVVAEIKAQGRARMRSRRAEAPWPAYEGP